MLRCTLAFVSSSLIFTTALQSAEPIPDIGPTGEVRKIHGDFQFTEGPAWDGEGALLFTDIPADRIYKVSEEKKNVFAEPAGHCNGLMFDGAGRLIACSMDGALVAFDHAGKKTVLAGEFEGKRFNAPNDLVIDRTGGVYFTDPRFRAPEPWPQGIEAVYYRNAAGKVVRVIADLNEKAPNGVILSPDEKTLYVVCSMQAEILAYDVMEPGKLERPRVFASLKQPAGQRTSGGDGLTVDTNGNLYITSGLGVQIFSEKGKLLGIVEVPEQPANVTFGGADRNTLYATARTGLYAVPMAAEGHQFKGQVQ